MESFKYSVKIESSYFAAGTSFRNQFFINEGIIKKAIEDHGVA